ncbi:MAG: dephospho-CoA kinase [Clostridia bacterium]|nr:dephospho-CoA kinase [Clostridia bacterium]
MLIGLCGGSGSGKGAVSKILCEIGIPTIDTDAVYHDLTSRPTECLDELVGEFGEGIIKDSALDRAALRDIVFKEGQDPLLHKRLGEITYKHIIKEALGIAESYFDSGAKDVVIDAPMLFEAGLDSLCDKLICVVADKDVRVERIIARDGISREKALSRIAHQLDDKCLIARCDAVIYNNGDLKQLKDGVLRALKSIY